MGVEAEKRKLFSYTEANDFLPEVRRRTEEAYRQVERLARAFEEVGGPPGLEELQARVHEVVSGWAHSLTSEGLEVKGLWLVDFDNGSGYYCWRYPEDGLHYYHTYEEGFRGRMRIQ